MQTDLEAALIGINHLAERLGLSRRTIHRILARGELPSIRIGGRRLVRLSDLRRWLAGYEEPTPGANVTNPHHQFVERTALRWRHMATILHTGGVSSESPEKEGVKDSRRAVAAPHGLSHHERDLLTESFDHMRQLGPGLFASIEAGKSPDAERVVRAMTRRVRSDLAQRQRRAGMRRVRMTTVFEARDRKGREKFGAHIVAVMPNAAARDGAIEALNGSSVYAGSLPPKARPCRPFSSRHSPFGRERAAERAHRLHPPRLGIRQQDAGVRHV